MEQTFETNMSPAPIRNAFITVLCILTFIGSGFGLFNAMTSYITADKTVQKAEAAKEKIDEQMSGQEQPAFMKNMMGGFFNNMSADNIRKSSLITLLSNLLTLGGAILMWALRKSGYYLYIAGVLMAIFAPLIIFGGGLIGLASAGGTALIGLVFIILYGVNVKYMVN